MQIASTAVLDYFAALDRAIATVEITDASGAAIDQQAGILRAGTAIHETSAARRTIFVVGNGGSAGIASQVSYALTHACGLGALCLNDPSALTGIGADHGYDQVFSRQLAAYARSGDYLIAISSSGQSANILNAVSAARTAGIGVITLSGFKPENPLRRSGDVNMYVDSREYGFVEVAHLALCHIIADVPAARP